MSTKAIRTSNVSKIKQELAERALCRKRLLPFVKRNVIGYEAGWIHKEICEKLEKFEEDVIAKKSPRLMLFMPPRHGKSELASIQFPSWFLGRHPSKEVITCSYSASLAMDFSKEVRELIKQPEYTAVFPEMQLSKESQSTEHWHTTKGGSFLAAGVGGATTGYGADCLIIDDPVRNREAADSATERNKVGNWYSSTAYTRLMPGGGVLLILTRWHVDDLAGRLLYEMTQGGEEWEVIVYPATATHQEKYRNIGDALHPERYDQVALARIKKAQTARDWGALYQQSPSTEAGSILKREYWNRWCADKPPDYTYLIQSLDTAYSAKETADFNVISTWGLFHPEGKMADHELQAEYQHEDESPHIFDGEVAHLILLDVVKKRLSFTDLKKEAFRLAKYWNPDSIIIEAKASGLPLAHELRQGGVPVQTFTPSRGTDKLARVNSVSVLLENGLLWAPKTKWADDLIEECHNFPMSKHDDQVDSTTGALMRFRKGGLLRLSTDDSEPYTPRRAIKYY